MVPVLPFVPTQRSFLDDCWHSRISLFRWYTEYSTTSGIFSPLTFHLSFPLPTPFLILFLTFLSPFLSLTCLFILIPFLPHLSLTPPSHFPLPSFLCIFLLIILPPSTSAQLYSLQVLKLFSFLTSLPPSPDTSCLKLLLIAWLRPHTPHSMNWLFSVPSSNPFNSIAKSSSSYCNSAPPCRANSFQPIPDVKVHIAKCKRP